MPWKVVSIDRKVSTRGVPTASIGFGRIALNNAACNLIVNFENYNFVELLTDSDRPSIVAVRFLVNQNENSLPIKRRNCSGKSHGGADIYSKIHMQKLFGIKGTQNKTSPYKVVKESDNIIVIDTD